MLVVVAEKAPSLAWLLPWVRSQLDVLDDPASKRLAPPKKTGGTGTPCSGAGTLESDLRRSEWHGSCRCEPMRR